MTEHDINGWTFTVKDDPARPAPWVYQNVKNWNHNFANEISIEKIIVEVEKDGKSEELSLNSSDFESLRGGQPGLVRHDLKTAQHTVSLANFAVYQGNGLLLDLVTKKGVLPANVVNGKPFDEPLYIFITFLFAKYDNDPPHEFTGSLLAARFTPAFSFETMNDSVRSIRVDYRFHFDLDSYLQSASLLTRGAAELKKEIWGKENYALVLKDGDHFPQSLMGVVGLLKDVFGLYEGLKFFEARLDECGYGGTCRFQTSGLELQLSNSGTSELDRLNVTFRDPRLTLADASKALAKTSSSVKDKSVVAVSVAGPAKYDRTQVDVLAAKIFNVVVGPTKPAKVISPYPLPGVSSECLLSYIKHSLVRLAVENYIQREGEAIGKQVGPLLATMESDLKDVLKYLKWGDVTKVLGDIESFIKSILMEPVTPILGPLMTLVAFKKLVKDAQALVGKLISIVGFDGAEKPVLYELVGRFVEEWGEVSDTWDNMHWWGTEKIPSAPGAFHAVHTHFRWSQLNTYPTPREEEIIEAAFARGGNKAELRNKTPQLRSLVKRFVENQLSGPLIDPNIPNQTVYFAIALNGGDLDEELKTSAKPFKEANAIPQLIATVSENGNTGKDIVYWLSCKARRTGKEDFKGVMLVNGFYFAHDEEKPLSLFLPSNMFGPTEGVDLQKPTREKPYKLFRSPFY